jgi:hypothetical protein
MGVIMNKFQPGRLRGKAPEIAALYLAGKSTPEIARLYSVSNGAVKNCLVTHGVPRRSNSEAQKLIPKATHCKRGHARTPENVTKTGHCRVCVKYQESRRYGKNPEKVKAYRREWRAANPDKTAGHDLQKKYGLSFQEREAKRTEQNNQCKICGDEFINTPHVDHDHITGIVRDLLCERCNPGIALFLHDPVRLEAAVIYCRRWKEIIDARIEGCSYKRIT